MRPAGLIVTALPDTCRHALCHPKLMSNSKWPCPWAGQGGEQHIKAGLCLKAVLDLLAAAFAGLCVPGSHLVAICHTALLSYPAAWWQSAIQLSCPMSPSHTVAEPCPSPAQVNIFDSSLAFPELCALNRH